MSTKQSEQSNVLVYEQLYIKLSEAKQKYGLGPLWDRSLGQLKEEYGQIVVPPFTETILAGDPDIEGGVDDIELWHISNYMQEHSPFFKDSVKEDSYFAQFKKALWGEDTSPDLMTPF